MQAENLPNVPKEQKVQRVHGLRQVQKYQIWPAQAGVKKDLQQKGFNNLKNLQPKLRDGL